MRSSTHGCGEISGLDDGGVAVFKGIPYAKSPFSEHRFATPAPPDSIVSKAPAEEVARSRH